jgi:chitinase
MRTRCTSGATFIAWLAALLVSALPAGAGFGGSRPGTVEIGYLVVSRWPQGFTAQLTISNNGPRALQDWQLAFRLPARITQIWNAAILSNRDDRYVLGPAVWADQNTLAPGRSLRIGWVASGQPIAPTGVALNEVPVRLNEPFATPPPTRARVVAATAWPRNSFAPYVDATLWPPLSLSTAAAQLGLRHFRLGFIVAASLSEPRPTWGGTVSATSAFRLGEINEIRNRGGDVALSLGGQAGVELALAARSTTELVTAYQSVIDTYQARVLDFDLEGLALTDHPSIERRAEALAIIQQAMTRAHRPLEIWLTLPALPRGLTAGGTQVIRSALAHGVQLRGVNAMTMNYGEAVAPGSRGRMGQYALQAARSVHEQLRALFAASGRSLDEVQLWHMIGLTPMIGRNDVGEEIFELSDADRLLSFASARHIGALSLWSLNRDRPCGPTGSAQGQEVRASAICSSIAQLPYEFTRILRTFDALSE